MILSFGFHICGPLSNVNLIFSKKLKLMTIKQSPVLLFNLIVLHLNIILKQMQITQLRNNIWEQLVRLSIENSMEWSSFEKQFQIKKLQLEKLLPNQILQRKSEFEKKYHQQHRISKSWMENEYRLFIWFLFMYSKLVVFSPENFTHLEWNLISQCFSKQPLFCQYFYLSSKKMKSSEWTNQEDSFVEKLMAGQFNKKWTQIGLELFINSEGRYFKKPKAIRQRWLSHLDPKIKKQDWDLNQDYELVKNIKEKGKKWSKIAKIIGNRTEHSIKNRYNQLISKYMKDHKIEQQKNQENLKDKILDELMNSFQKSLKKKQITNELGKPQISSNTSIQIPFYVKCEESELIHTNYKLFTPIIITKSNFEQLNHTLERQTNIGKKSCLKKSQKLLKKSLQN